MENEILKIWLQAPLVADVLFSTEGLVIIGSLLTVLTGTVAYIFKLLIDNYNVRLSEKDTIIASWKQMSTESVGNLRKAANAARRQKGQEPYPELEAVVPEHSSPATETAKGVAEMATIRAVLVAATKDLGLDPRPTDVADKAAEVADKAIEVAQELAAKAEDSAGEKTDAKEKP